MDTSTQGILRNAVASQSGNLFLVGWLDGRLATTHRGTLMILRRRGRDGDRRARTGSGVHDHGPTSRLAPLAMNFDSAGSTGAFDTLQWDFGDGTTSTSASVAHTYKIHGTFTAQLTLTKGA